MPPDGTIYVADDCPAGGCLRPGLPGPPHTQASRRLSPRAASSSPPRASSSGRADGQPDRLPWITPSTARRRVLPGLLVVSGGVPASPGSSAYLQKPIAPGAGPRPGGRPVCRDASEPRACTHPGRSRHRGPVDRLVGRWTSINRWASLFGRVRCPTDTTPLTADAGGPYTVEEGRTITLDASGTTDPVRPPRPSLFSGTSTATAFGETGSAATNGDEVGLHPHFRRRPARQQHPDGPARGHRRARVHETATATITIENVPPVVDLAAAATVDPGATFAIQGDVHDPGAGNFHRRGRLRRRGR